MSATGEDAPLRVEQHVFTKPAPRSPYAWFSSAPGDVIAPSLVQNAFQRGNWTAPRERSRVTASFPLETPRGLVWAVVDYALNVAHAGRQFHRTRVAVIPWERLRTLGSPAPLFDALEATPSDALDALPTLLVSPEGSASREAVARCEAALGARWAHLLEACRHRRRIAVDLDVPNASLSLRDLQAALFASLDEAHWSALGALDAGVCAEESEFSIFLDAAPAPGSAVIVLDVAGAQPPELDARGCTVLRQPPSLINAIDDAISHHVAAAPRAAWRAHKRTRTLRAFPRVVPRLGEKPTRSAPRGGRAPCVVSMLAGLLATICAFGSRTPPPSTPTRVAVAPAAPTARPALSSIDDAVLLAASDQTAAPVVERAVPVVAHRVVVRVSPRPVRATPRRLVEVRRPPPLPTRPSRETSEAEGEPTHADEASPRTPSLGGVSPRREEASNTAAARVSGEISEHGLGATTTLVGVNALDRHDAGARPARTEHEPPINRDADRDAGSTPASR